jgi:hypothetical protein
VYDRDRRSGKFGAVEGVCAMRRPLKALSNMTLQLSVVLPRFARADARS